MHFLTVNTQAGHFHYNYSGLLEISSYIPVKCCLSQIRSLTWVWTIVILGTLQWLMRNSKLHTCKLFSQVLTLFTHLSLGYDIICIETILVTIYQSSKRPVTFLPLPLQVDNNFIEFWINPSGRVWDSFYWGRLIHLLMEIKVVSL